MRYVLYIAGGLAALVVIIVVIGYTLPVQHRASREAEYPVSAERLFALISTPADFPKWRSDVKQVDLLPPHDGKARFKEIGKNGTMTFEVERSTPNRELRLRIADKGLPFGGTWTYELTPVGAGRSKLRITEDGEVYNPIFRFVSRFIMGHTATIDSYLAAVSRHVGATIASQ
jgi:polyketide cyclase/dehydrase/lipid transport protein